MNNSVNKMKTRTKRGLDSNQKLIGDEISSIQSIKVGKGVLKRTILLSAFILLSTTITLGQIQLGAEAGLNTSTQSGLGDIWDNNGIYCNINAGFISQYKINDWFALKTGLLYSEKGTAKDVRINGSDVRQVDKFKYLEVPLKARFSAKSGVKNHQLFASVGPYAAFLLDSKRKVEGEKFDLDDQTRDADFGLAFELGVEIPILKNNLQVYLNYDMGLSEIAKYDSDLKNKTLSLNVAWLF